LLEIRIPGAQTLRLSHLVVDYNGTIAVDGVLLPGLHERLKLLAPQLQLHVVTADTFGQVQKQLQGIACQLSILDAEHQAEAKLAYVERLGAASTACIGNGRNDRLMLAAAALGIAVIQEECAAAATVQAADVVATSILDALDLLANPLRLIATLRE
jgi:soluble P-type ATPase